MPNKKTISIFIFLAIFGLGVFAFSSQAQAVGDCNDGMDNDGDGNCDLVGRDFNGDGDCTDTGEASGSTGDVGCQRDDDDVIGTSETYPGKKIVSSISRLSHPAISMDSLYNYNPIWNVDKTRVLMYDLGTSGLAHPSFSSTRTGRQYIWGCIASSCVTDVSGQGGEGDAITSTLQALDLENATGDASLTAWDTNTIHISSDFWEAPVWSPYTDEPHIIYAICQATTDGCSGLLNHLVAMNLDTGQIKDIYNIPTTYKLTGNMQVIGFSKDATTNALGHHDQIAIDINNSGAGWGRASGWTIVVDIDRTGIFTYGTPTAYYYSGDQPGTCDTRMAWWPFPVTDHGNVSSDSLYAPVEYAMYKIDNEGGTCNGNTCTAAGVPFACCTGYAAGCTGVPPFLADQWWWDYRGKGQLSGYVNTGLTHVQSRTSADWYIGSNSIQHPYTYTTYTTPNFGNTSDSDSHDERIYQVFFDRTLANESGHSPAHIAADCNGAYADYNNCYCPECFRHHLLVARQSAGQYTYAGASRNYSAIPMAQTSADGTLMSFMGTNAKYTRYDKQNFSAQVGTNWEGIGVYIAYLVPAGDNPADVDGSGSVNIKDIQACVRVITNSETNQTIIDNCKNLVSDTPVNVANIKDTQKIVQAIIGQ